MAMVVKNNMTAINTLNTLNKNTSALSKSLQKVSSGMKINSAADDASGYAISERMRVQIRSLDQANQNTQNGSSMMKVAEGAVSSTVEILKTLKEKAVNAANDSNTDSDRQTIQKELDQSIDQINDNANVTFNGKYLVDGSKNSKGEATYTVTVLTNQSLATSTTAGTALKDLCARSGDSLEIATTDTITVSYVQGGKTQTTSFKVGDKTLQDIFTAADDIETDPDNKLFADVTNESVYKSMGTKTAQEAEEAKKKANKMLYGVEEDTDKANTLSKRLEAGEQKDDCAAKLLDTTLQDGAGSQNLAHLISVYNKGAHEGDKINETALEQWMTFDDTTATAGEKNNATQAITEGEVGNAEVNADSAEAKAKLMETLTNDANYSKLLVSAITVYNSTDGATIGALVKKIDNAYNGDTTAADGSVEKKGYVGALQDYKAAHTSVVTSSTVGIDANGDEVHTASGEQGISVTAKTAGVSGQISGFTISVSDSKGNVKKSANAALDAFSETIRAQNASEDNSITLQVGASANQSIKVGLTDMRSEALGLKGADGTTLNISTQAKANAAINVLDNAIQKALDQQTTIGSVESRLEYTASNLTTASENVQSSESTIRDADMAKEMTEYTKNNVLMQAAQSMLAQANQSSSNVLSLLQ